MQYEKEVSLLKILTENDNLEDIGLQLVGVGQELIDLHNSSAVELHEELHDPDTGVVSLYTEDPLVAEEYGFEKTDDDSDDDDDMSFDLFGD